MPWGKSRDFLSKRFFNQETYIYGSNGPEGILCRKVALVLISVLNYTNSKKGPIKSKNMQYTILSIRVTRRNSPYAGFTSSSCGRLRPPAEAFLAFWAKKELFMLFWLTLCHFWCSAVASVTFSSYLRNFQKKNKE